MQIRSLVLGAALALGTAFSGQAQETLDGSNVDEILNIARGYGSASVSKQDNGDPKIGGKIEGVQYWVYFETCTDNANCEDLNFYAGFLDNKQTMDAINAWNRDKRFAFAFLDSDLDAVITMDLNLEYGVAQQNLDATYGLWASLLGQFATYIGHK